MNYLHAKDENRPHILERVFDANAELVVVDDSDAISFPARTIGRGEVIARHVLVRNFGQTYENVYSFYLNNLSADTAAFSCDWLGPQCRRSKANPYVSGAVGYNDWSFAQAAPQLASGPHHHDSCNRATLAC